MTDRDRGLTEREAAARLVRDGRNALPSPKPPPAWRQLVAQLTHFFALMLWVAGVLAFVAKLPQLGVAIFVVVVVNGVFAFVQESRAEHAAERLRDLLPRRVIVLRDGEPLEIDAAELVVDDLVILAAGDRVSADLRVLRSHTLRVDASLLTGESEPVAVDDDGQIFAGTFVVEGEGRAVVEATGSNTRLATIATMTQAGRRPRSPLAHELDRVVRTVALIAVGVGLVFFGIALGVGSPASDGFLFAIGVTVALVPEGLLPTVTLSLAMGAQRMAARARARPPSGVGRDTRVDDLHLHRQDRNTHPKRDGRRRGVDARRARIGITSAGYDPNAATRRRRGVGAVAARPGPRCSSLLDRARGAARRSLDCLGDPMEAAIDTLAQRLGHRRRRGRSGGSGRPAVSRSIRAGDACRSWSGDRLFVKGAPDALLARCRDGGRARRRGRRHGRPGGCACWLSRDVRRPGSPTERRPTPPSRDLELLGLLGLEDPPRPERRGRDRGLPAGRHPRRDGHRRSPCHRAGDRRARSVSSITTAVVLEGKDLPADEQVLGALLDRDGVVLARIDARGQAAHRPRRCRPAVTSSR